MKRFTVREAAKELGISVSLMYGLLERRRIRHERHGLGRGRYLIPDDALAEYRNGRTVNVEVVPAPARLRHITLR